MKKIFADLQNIKTESHIILFVTVILIGYFLNGATSILAQDASTTTTTTTTTITTTVNTPTSPTVLNAATVTIPAMPSNLMLDGTPTVSMIKLKWTDNSTNEDRFNIERKLTNATGYAYTVRTVGTSISSYTDTSVTANTTYDYRVQACQATNCSDYVYLNGVVVPVVSGEGSVTSTIPLSPTNLVLAAAPSATTVALHWTDNATNEDKFNIERKLSTATAFSYLNQITGANITNYVDNTVAPGVSYDYRVQACLSGTGCSTDYATLSGVTTLTVSGGSNGDGSSNTTVTAAPLAPSAINAAPACNSIALSWSSATGATHYRILKNGTILGLPTTAAYNDTSVAIGMSYHYMVYSMNQYGTSAGVSVSATIPTTCSATYGLINPVNGNSTTTVITTATISLPASPTNLVLAAAPSATTVALRWTDNATNEDKFNIERKLSTAMAFSYLNQITGANITNYVDNTVAPGVSYDYRVQACLSGTGCSRDYAMLSGVRTMTTAIRIATTTVVNTRIIAATTTVANMRVIATTTTVATKDASVLAISKTATATTSAMIATNQFESDYSKHSTTTVNNPPPTYFNVKTSPVKDIPLILTAQKIAVTASTSASNFKKPQSVAVNRVASTSHGVIKQLNDSTVVTPEVVNMQNVSNVINDSKQAIDDTKKELVRIVDRNIDQAIRNNFATNTKDIQAIRQELVARIDSSLDGISAITPKKIDNLNVELKHGLEDIHSIARASTTVAISASTTSTVSTEANSVSNTLASLSTTMKDQATALASVGGDTLYKDTNKDGISDYDSTHIYNIDPVKPSVVTNYGAGTMNAGEKILLGYDPKQAVLVKVAPEEPATATSAPIVAVYKVGEVKLTENNKVVIKGQALPNSFVTVYVYSTPIIVTVRANSDGEWQYILNKELDSGEHTVFAATVNNSGKIVAKSSGFAFTKTAEAATLNTVPPIVSSSDIHQPNLFDNMTIYILTAISLVLVFLILYVIGRSLNDTNKVQGIQ